MRIESSTLCAITGIITLSSSCPCSAAMATVVSRPITWKQTWLTISGIDGLILPGMIDEPGCTAGSLISSMPVRGPITMRRRSLAILLRSSASTRSDALNAGHVAHALHELDAVLADAQVEAADRLAGACSSAPGYSFSTVTPVPTALPPMPRSRR